MSYKFELKKEAATIRLTGPFIWCETCGKFIPTGCFRCIGTSLHTGCNADLTASYRIEQKAGYSVERLVDFLVTTLNTHFQHVSKTLRAVTTTATAQVPHAIDRAVTESGPASSIDNPRIKRYRSSSAVYRQSDRKGLQSWTCGEQTFIGEAMRCR